MESSPAPLIPFFFETEPPLPAATKDSLFFRLPRELRDEVYGCIWLKTHIRPRELNRIYSFYYGDWSSDACLSKLPRGLLACKLLLSESLEQY
jgi:hypothetical protein